MPYSKLSEARIKKLDGVALTLEQANKLAEMADAIGGDFGWPTAIKNFKKSHTIKDGAWVSKKAEEKEYSLLAAFLKEDGRYQLVGISTAAIRDREGETFTTQAIDYDIAKSKETNEYPEFRMFHTKGFGIGRVESMRRVGIFAVDSGTSYDDPFSLACCAAIAKDTTGKWRMSRGFYLLEASGGCPRCGEGLVIRSKHMVAGFKCPTCQSTHLYDKGVLKEMHFLKTRTFDDTITDIPCVPFTGVAAFKTSNMEDILMNMKQLKEKLVAAGVEPALVDERLASVTEKQLESLGDDIPEATLLKELQIEKEDDGGGDDAQLFVLDPNVLKDFGSIVEAAVSKVVATEVKKAIDSLEIELAIPEMKELSELAPLGESLEAIKKELGELKELVGNLTVKDDQRLKEMLGAAPRAAKYRIM